MISTIHMMVNKGIYNELLLKFLINKNIILICIPETWFPLYYKKVSYINKYFQF